MCLPNPKICLRNAIPPSTGPTGHVVAGQVATADSITRDGWYFFGLLQVLNGDNPDFSLVIGVPPTNIVSPCRTGSRTCDLRPTHSQAGEVESSRRRGDPVRGASHRQA